jgi:hypothetical protein
MINDVLDETGKKMSFQKFQDTYDIQTNFLTYHGVTTAISFYIKISNIPINDLEKLNNYYKYLYLIGLFVILIAVLYMH